MNEEDLVREAEQGYDLSKLRRRVNKNHRSWDHILYVPSGVSWDNTWDYAVKRLRQDRTVFIHEHSIKESCVVGPDGATRCGELTADGDSVKLVPAS